MADEDRAVRRARRLLRHIGAQEGIRDAVEYTAELLASELVTNSLNAYRGRAGWITVAIRLTQGRLLVAVADTAPGRPRPRHARPGAERGRGLAIVRSESAAWGWRGRPRRKYVWFSLRLDMAEPGSQPVPEPDLDQWADVA